MKLREGLESKEGVSSSVVLDIKEVSKRTIQLLKVTLGMVIPVMFINFYQGIYLSAAILAVYVLTLGLILFLTSKGYFKYTKLFIATSVSLFLLLITIAEGKDSAAYFYFFPLFFCLPFIIENNNNYKKELFFYLSVAFLSFLLSISLSDNTSAWQSIPPEIIHFKFYQNSIASLSLCSAFAFLSIYFERKYSSALIEEKQKAEEATKEAKRANEAKSTFLATMSHEIRTPMNGVIGMATLLNSTPLNLEQEEYVNIISTSGDALLGLINDILDYSKIESGGLELEQQSFELRDCIEDIMDLFSGSSAKRGLELIYQIDPEVPVYIMGDSHRLRQVLINLINNALKFTNAGEVFIKVSTEQYLQDEILLLFEVKDTGIGIPDSKIPKLFKAFSQIDTSTTRKYGGTGLGLVISEKLVKLMGGEISVKSKVGSGSTFSFTIKSKILNQSQPSFLNDTVKSKKVLIVDDNANYLNVLKAQLQRWKLEPTIALSGKDALMILSKNNDFNMVITDMLMPQMDGVELATEIKKITPNIPITLLSAVDDENRFKYPHLFSSVLIKPVKERQLLQTLKDEFKENSVVNLIETGKKEHFEFSEDFAVQYPLSILLAEDNLINQKLAIKILNKLGYKPDLAINGVEAVGMQLNKKYNLILMDVQMPEMNGLEATRIIRSNSTNDLQIIAITANVMPEDREECINSGMDNYISKPFKIDELITVLKNAALKR